MTKHRGKKESDSELRKHVAHFIDETDSPHTLVKYDKWAKQRDLPSSVIITRRLGSWINLVTELGGKTITANPLKGKAKTFDYESVIRAIVPLFRDKPSLTVTEYKLITHNDANLPSASTVLALFDLKWTNVRDTIRQILDGTHPKGKEWVEQMLIPLGEVKPYSKIYDIDENGAFRIIEQALQEVDGPLTIVKYGKWSRSHDSIPYTTLLNRTGMTWSELVSHVGGKAGKKRKRHSKSQLRGVLRSFALSSTEHTRQGYSRWRNGPTSLPDVDVILRHFDTWENVLKEIENITQNSLETEVSHNLDNCAESIESRVRQEVEEYEESLEALQKLHADRLSQIAREFGSSEELIASQASALRKSDLRC